MIPDGFMAYLILLDPQGRTLAIRNGVEGTNPTIGLTLPATGTYTIVATSTYADETGPYQIQVQVATADTPTANENTSPDVELAAPPVQPLTFNGVLDPNVSILDGVPFVGEHTFEGVEGQAIAIEMNSSDFDAYLTLLDPQGNSLAQNDNGLRRTDARIVTLLPTTGTYTIQALSVGNSLGRYQVRMRAANANEMPLIEAEQLDRQAMQLFYQMRYQEALALVEHQVQILEHALGDNHPDIRPSLNNLALVHEYLGHSAQAEALHQRALSIAEQTWGANHTNVVTELNNLASFYRRQGNTTEAEQLAQRASQIEAHLSPTPTTETSSTNEHPALTVAEQVEQLNQQSAQLYQQGRYDDAILQIKQALQLLEEPLDRNSPDRAPVNSDLELYQHYRGSDAQAEALYLRALHIQEQTLGDTDLAVATTLNNLAGLYRRQGELAKAHPLYERSLQIREQRLGDNHPDVATSLNNLALLYQAQKNYAQAESLYQRSLHIFEQHFEPTHPNILTALDNLAILYAVQAKYAQAQPFFLQVLHLQEQNLGAEQGGLAITLNRLAEVYRRQNNYTQAEPLYVRSLHMQEQALRTQEQQLNDDNISNFAQNATDFAYSLTHLASLYQAQGNYAKADPLYHQALRILRRFLGTDHPDVANIFNNLALLNKAQSNYAQAEFFYLQALDILIKISANSETDPAVANTLNSLTDLYLVQGNPAQVAILRRSIDEAVSHHLQDGITNQDAAKQALETVLRQKGRSLETMTDAVQRLRHLHPQDQVLLGDLRVKQSQLATLLYGETGDRAPDTYRTQVTTLRSQIATLENTLAQRNEGWVRDFMPVSLDAIANQIPADAALIEFVQYQPFNPVATLNRLWGSPRYAAYVLDAEGTVQGIDLGDAAAIDALVSQYLDTLRRRSFRIKDIARQLDTQIMQPIRQKLGTAHHLLISPDGQLNLIPFAALVDESDRYLVETYTLTYLTSGRDLLRSTTNTPNHQPPVVIANPDYNFSDNPSSAQIASAASGSITRGSASASNPRSIDLSTQTFGVLPGTEQEANAILSLFPNAQLLSGSHATENTLKRLQSPSILHIATHGFFFRDVQFVPPPGSLEQDVPASLFALTERSGETLREGDRTPSPNPSIHNENPLLRSGLALAGFNSRQSGTEDGVLTALEASGLNLQGTRLVVLSACDTGVGDVVNGEGVYGLRRAFFMAGAESQLMSLWKVDDDATSELMAHFYQRLQQGEPRSEAFRQVQLELLQIPEYRHPYFWAAFIFSGDWRSLGTD
jgi:CHAT domain-containing protein